MRIRKSQMRELGKGLRAREEESIITTALQTAYPTKCAQMGGQQLLERIRKGTSRARTYGLEALEDRLAFISVMLTFGDDFDRRSDTAWAQEILVGNLSPGPKRELLLHRARSVKGRSTHVPL